MDGKRRRLCTALLILNLAFIWGNSLMTAEISSAISGFVGKVLETLFRLPVGSGGSGHGLLRKLAHFSEFACLGALIFWRLAMAGQQGKTRLALTFGAVLCVACLDETIQRFVPGRASSLIDVWIDTAGGMTGMFLLLAGYTVHRKNKDNLHFGGYDR